MNRFPAYPPKSHRSGQARIRTVWRWAETQRLVPPGSWGHLCTLPPIPRYRKVREAPARTAVADNVVEATLKHVSPIISAMIRVHLATGMRPGELVAMRAGEVTIGEDGIGEYRFEFHKGHWRDGLKKTVILPAEAVKVMAPWLEAAARIGPEAAIWRPGANQIKGYGVAGIIARLPEDACEAVYPIGIRTRRGTG